jgi:predicted outer membrane repeat protein/parallel beta-helix repeat protein
MAEVYVDSSNPGPGDGTQGNPFSDLKSAVDYDLALSNQSPCLGTGKDGVNMGADTGVCNSAGLPARIIHVAPGVYSVNGLCLAHNVSVYGAGEQVTVVEGTLFGLRTDTVVSNLKVTKGTLEGIRVGSDETPEILQCIISDNKGGVFCSEGSSPNLTNCTIKSNNGRGVYCQKWASPNLTGCMIIDNNSNGFSSEYWCSPTLTNCTISGNSAITGGGIFFSKIGYPILTNCKIINNYAEYSGGGVALNESCYPTLINCTIAGNWGGIGGGLSLDWDCVPVLTNCILWGNSDNSGSGEAAQIQNTTMGTPVINYCCLQGWTGSLGGIGNIGDNPLFVDVATDNYHLMAGSPCINMGDNSVIQPSVLTDLDGKPRIVNGKVDMGVYEYQDFQTLYVDADAPPDGDGKSWATAFRHLQDALFDVTHPSEIRVAQGIYKPHLNTYSAAPPSRTDTFQLKNGVTIKGGYAGLGQPDPDARDISLYDTILSGDMNGDDVDVNDPCDLRMETSRSDNNYHVLTGNGTVASAILDGFTITGGLANGASNEQHRGGGMTNMNGSPTVMNCTFRANAAANGGGLFCLEGTSILSNCTFEGNYGWASGGGIKNSSVHMRLNECTFIGNVAIWGGGGMISHGPITLSNCVFNSNFSPGGNGGGMANDGLIYTMTNCTFINNSANCGGAIRNIDCKDEPENIPTVTDCTFSGNSAAENGGAIFNSYSATTLTNCIFNDNSSNRMGGGIYNEDYSESYLTTCTFSNNSANQRGGAIYIRDAFSGTFTDSIFENNTAAGRGGAILHTGFGELDVIRCEFRDGSAERGGAIYNTNASLLLSQCILVDNQAEQVLSKLTGISH